MVSNDLRKKVLAITISALLVALIFFILVPSTTAVKLKPGTPNSTSVTTGTTITFTNVNLTIRGVEKIPVNNLTFKVYNNGNNQVVGYVIFYINGTEIEDSPSGRFTVTNTTAIGSGWSEYGYQNGTDEETSQNYNFGYGYGYGYGGASGYTDITFLYTIVYTTHTTGTFYARLLVNSTSYTYQSDKSTTFTVSTPGAPGGGAGGGGAMPGEAEEEEAKTEATKNVEENFNITLEYNLSATDTDGDGINDTFNYPSDTLQNEFDNNILIDGSASFLISIGGDLDNLFIWDTNSDSITKVTHSIGTPIGSPVVDTDKKTVTETVVVSKSEGNWIYIEVDDRYPDNDLTVKTEDGRTISSSMMKRENGKIYILDDPTFEYYLIYSYKGFLFDVLLELTSDSVTVGESLDALITLINVGEPGLINGTVTYTLYKEGVVVWSEVEEVSVTGQKAYNKTISTDDLSSGDYTYEVIYSYGDGQTASSSQTFTISTVSPVERIPLWIFAVLLFIIVFVVIIFVFFKTGYLHLEKKGKDWESREIEKIDKKIDDIGKRIRNLDERDIDSD